MNFLRTIAGLLLIAFALCASAAPSISLEWGPSPDADVNNYRLYWGPGSGNYNGFADLGNVTNTVFTQLVRGAHYFFVVTAMNAEGAESDPSNEIDCVVPKVRASGALVLPAVVEASVDLRTWAAVASVELDADAPAGFYRLRLARPPVAAAASTLSAASMPLQPVKAPFTQAAMARKRNKATPPPLPR